MQNIKPEFINAKKSACLTERAMRLRNKIQPVVAMFLLGTSSLANALPDDAATETSAFVDSVYEWGAWELGIEPAAGGSAPMPDRALNVRLANVKFRPNDNTTFSPGASPVTVTTPVAPAKLPPVFSFPSPTGTAPITNTPDPFK